MMRLRGKSRPNRSSGGAILAAALALWLSSAGTAGADFHLLSIREVFPGGSGQPDAEYVELQAYAAGQNFVAGHTVAFYDSSGKPTGSETFASDVPNGANQMTVLLATPAAESAFGVVADEGMTSNLIDPTGGAICWASLDCVSWGAFAGSLPSSAGPPAAGIPDGMALRRTIAPGCPTLLELLDDRDNSALDFSAVFPAPRPNSVAPSERACATGGSGAGPAGGAPQTTFRIKPAKRTSDRTPTFRFASDEAGSTFQCKLDRKPYRSCRSPFTTKRLSLGRHAFRVRARDASGLLDPSPAFHAFRVIARR